jgi:hypothetical protein
MRSLITRKHRTCAATVEVRSTEKAPRNIAWGVFSVLRQGVNIGSCLLNKFNVI